MHYTELHGYRFTWYTHKKVFQRLLCFYRPKSNKLYGDTNRANFAFKQHSVDLDQLSRLCCGWWYIPFALAHLKHSCSHRSRTLARKSILRPFPRCIIHQLSVWGNGYFTGPTTLQAVSPLVVETTTANFYLTKTSSLPTMRFDSNCLINSNDATSRTDFF